MKKKGLVVLAAAMALTITAALALVAPRVSRLSTTVDSGSPPIVALGEEARGVLPAPGPAGIVKPSGSLASDAKAQGNVTGEAGQDQSSDRMVVYNNAISLAVESVPESVNAVSSLAEGVGGYVSGTSLRYQDDKEYATLTLRVPATAYTGVMNTLRKMAVKVNNETGNARDVTEEYTDLGSQLRNYEATEAQYLALLKQAKTIDEILKVQAKLTEVRGQIERTKGRINLLQRTADMATIAVSLTPVAAAKDTEPRPIWDPAKSVQEAWEQSLALVSALADVGLRVVVFSWWLAPPALLAWAAWAATRRPKGQRVAEA